MAFNKIGGTVDLKTHQNSVSQLGNINESMYAEKIRDTQQKQINMTTSQISISKQQFHDLFEKPIYIDNSLLTTIYIIGIDGSLVIQSLNQDLSKIISVLKTNNKMKIPNSIYNVDHFTMIDIETKDKKQMMCVTNTATMEHSNFVDDIPTNETIMQEYVWFLNVISEFGNIIIRK